jgi:methenyltetrahydrofolate cyclohydrolase
VSFATMTVREILQAFRSPEPVPGGGSAAALAGAIGASLLAMVGGLPKNTATGDQDRALLRDATMRATAFADRLMLLTDEDSRAFSLVAAAYRLPKGTPEEQAARRDRIQAALRAATEAPLETMRACAAALKSAIAVAELGQRSASSDVLVALELLGAGLRGARRNVDINLGGLKDDGYAAEVARACDQLEADADRDATAARRRIASPA